MGRKFWQRLAWGLGLTVVLPGLAYGSLLLSRPARAPVTRTLFDGVKYRRLVRHSPRPMLIHIVEIDLQAPGISVAVTAPTDPESRYFEAQTTSDFLENSGTQLAINGSFFYPFHSETPWNYYPRSGEPVSPIGQSIADGIPLVPARKDWGVLCIDAERRAAIFPMACPPATQQAIAGQSTLSLDGQHPDTSDRAYPRTVIAVDAGGETLWSILVDGRQPGYSEGATLEELAQIARDLGAIAALNLDGGGSTTLAVEAGSGARVLNSPIHTRIPGRERPVANHLGIRARPLLARQK